MATKLNPRFVLVVGSIREEYPDIPECINNEPGADRDGVALYDRQAKKVVLMLAPEYANAICLETLTAAPFTALENWFNGLTPAALRSEGLPV